MRTSFLLNSTLLVVAFSTLGLGTALAQTPTPTAPNPIFIRGDLGIRYNTRMNLESNGKPKEGFSDKYTMNVNIANSAVFRGTIDHRPNINGTFGINQTGLLNFDIGCDVVNPANPAQTRNIGKFYGTVPLDENNIYRFENGSLRAGIFGMGSAKGFESKFSGLAIGKPPSEVGLLQKIKKEAITLTKSSGGKTVAITISNYDKMEFQNLVLASGPVHIYPEVSLNGIMLYDYGRGAWHFKNISASYVSGNKKIQDTISGDVRWVESPSRKTTGEGEYIFDIRVNEPPPSESSVFAGPADESAFFTVDATNPALTGTMKYKDSFSGDRVIASSIGINLEGNKLEKQQAVYLFKMLFFVAAIPFNSE